MKLKRAKAYKKLMGYLQLNFKFREPYQVLVDEEIVLAAVAAKYDLVAGFERTLQGKVKVLIPQCVIEHLYRAKTPEAKEAVRLAKTFERRRCGDVPRRAKAAGAPADATAGAPEERLKSAYECLVECVGPTNKHRYIVATQKPKLRALLRGIPAVPLIYMNRSVMIMEPMSPATARVRKDIEDSKLTQGLNEVAPSGDAAAADEQARPRRKEKGPNPLSVKKRTRPAEDDKGDGLAKKRRKRGHKHTDEPAEAAEPAEPSEASPVALEI